MAKLSTNINSPKTSFFTKKIPIIWFITISLIAIISLAVEVEHAFSRGGKNSNSIVGSQVAPLSGNNPVQIQQNPGGYVFTNPVISCGGAPLKEIRPFKTEIQLEINKLISENEATDISVSFRTLNNGYSFGINADKLFRPASLLKVPTMIAYLKMAEDTPAILDRRMLYAKKMDISVPNSIPNPMVSGQSYTVRELIERMIINSDNDAALMLINNADEKYVYKIYDAFGINVPKMLGPGQDFSSVSDFSRVFRILYNASYLNKEMSDYALSVLSKVYFGDGIVAGVGNGIPVAHKYGEWYYNGVYQLHDCGIVYIQGSPYIIAVMTKGTDIHKLGGVIKRISGLIYSHVQINLQS